MVDFGLCVQRKINQKTIKTDKLSKALEKIIPLRCLELNLCLVIQFKYSLSVNKYSR